MASTLPAVPVRPTLSRSRNLSPWAHWMARLAATETEDPLPADRDAIPAWRSRVRDRLLALVGPDPESVPLELEVLDVADAGAYRRESVIFDTEDTMSVPAFMLVPHARESEPPGPAVLAIHGHGAGKAMVCGLDGGDPARRAEIDGYHADYARRLAEHGYVVLAPDLRGFGERRDRLPPGKDACDLDLVHAYAAGANPLALNLWDLRRCLDVLDAHPLVDTDRIGVVGLSYGGTCTLFLAALDERVRAAVVSGFFSSWRTAHTVPANLCGSQVLPGMLGRLEHVDLGALVAPRPLLVESGTDDPLFPVDTARAEIARLRRVYAALDAPEAIAHDVFEGPHRWHGADVHRFLDRHLR